MATIRTWVAAARPKTLPAGLVPVAAGCGLAHELSGAFDWGLALLVLASCLCIQIATNFFNDVIDFEKGADTEKRLGFQRVTQSGQATRRAVWIAAFVCLALASVLALPLILKRGWPIVAIGVVSLYLSYGYTGGPLPLAYRGLGELFVLIFFGLIAVGGTVFVQTGAWPWEAVLLGAQIGLLSCVLIAINNLRDVEEDSASGKRTFAVRFGPKAARVGIGVYLLLPYVLGLGWIAFKQMGAFLAPLPVALLGILLLVKVAKTPPSPAYNKFLALSSLHLLLFAFLFYVGLRWF